MEVSLVTYPMQPKARVHAAGGVCGGGVGALGYAAAQSERGTVGSLKRKDYEKLLEPCRASWWRWRRWVASEKPGERLLVLFEGRDTAGKGGRSRRSPTGSKPSAAVPHRRSSSKPSERETGQWYFERYVQHLPAQGRDRAVRPQLVQPGGVERVMGFCTEEPGRSLSATRSPAFERQLVDDGDLACSNIGFVRCDSGCSRRNASPTAGGPAEELEAVADRPRGAEEISRLHQGARGDAEGDAQGQDALGPGRFQRP